MTRTTKQLNIEIDITLADSLRDRAKKTGKSQRQILETLIEVWLTTNEGRGARHLDGTECPLSFFLQELSAQVRSMVEQQPPPVLELDHKSNDRAEQAAAALRR